MNRLSLRDNRSKFKTAGKLPVMHFGGIYRICPNLMKENRRMWTCNRLDVQTLGSQPVMPKNLPDHWWNRIDLSWSWDLVLGLLTRCKIWIGCSGNLWFHHLTVWSATKHNTHKHACWPGRAGHHLWAILIKEIFWPLQYHFHYMAKATKVVCPWMWILKYFYKHCGAFSPSPCQAIVLLTLGARTWMHFSLNFYSGWLYCCRAGIELLYAQFWRLQLKGSCYIFRNTRNKLHRWWIRFTFMIIHHTLKKIIMGRCLRGRNRRLLCRAQRNFTFHSKGTPKSELGDKDLILYTLTCATRSPYSNSSTLFGMSFTAVSKYMKYFLTWLSDGYSELCYE